MNDENFGNVLNGYILLLIIENKKNIIIFVQRLDPKMYGLSIFNVYD